MPNQSLMPEGLDSPLTEVELADMVHYLSTLNMPLLTAYQYSLHGPSPEDANTIAMLPDLKLSQSAIDGSKFGWQAKPTASNGKFALSVRLETRHGGHILTSLPSHPLIQRYASFVFNSQSPIEVHGDGRRFALDFANVDLQRMSTHIKTKLNRGISHLAI